MTLDCLPVPTHWLTPSHLISPCVSRLAWKKANLLLFGMIVFHVAYLPFVVFFSGFEHIHGIMRGSSATVIGALVSQLLVPTQWLIKSLMQAVPHSSIPPITARLSQGKRYPSFPEIPPVVSVVHYIANQESRQLTHCSTLNIAQEELWLSGRASVMYTEDPRFNSWHL